MSVEISWAISSGLVSRLLMASIRHSNGMFALCLNIVLCIVLGLRFRVAWYFVMVFLQLIVGCLMVILCSFVGFPMLASPSIQQWLVVESVGMGGNVEVL